MATPLEHQAAALHSAALGALAERHHRENGAWPEYGWVEQVNRGGRMVTVCKVGVVAPPWLPSVVRFGEKNG